ncbi:7861_t:CDS:1 [Cetraspora pellucida]|uniref:7861_t:CDS:1 n=1 Tax=Cetraspora pellucida TaxID=1433469 RepID=A0A9N9CXY9_9GLOM|nr:7861_t:CDS:1 [Cetraspora pellucida]
MNYIYFAINLLLFIFTLQSNSLTNAQKEPLAILWEVDDNKVPELLNIEKQLIMVDGILQPLLDSSSFGGSYIDVMKNKLFINTLDFSKAKYISSLRGVKQYNNLIEFKNASNSLVELRSKFQKIRDLAQQNLPKKVEIFIDMKENNVVVHIKRQLGDRKFIDAIMPFKPLILFVTSQKQSSSSFNSTHPSISKRDINNVILGGDGLYNEANGGICSTGLWARDKVDPNVTFIISAGHCFDQSKSNSENLFHYVPWNQNQPLGLVGSAIFYSLGPHDFLIIHVTGNIKPLSSIRNTDSILHKQLIISEVVPIYSHGAHICKSGYSTYVTCGYVKGLGATYIIDYTVMTDMIFADMINVPGDSGGCVFTYSQDLNSVNLVGIISSGNRGVKRNLISTIQPLKVILDTLDLVLVVLGQVVSV